MVLCARCGPVSESQLVGLFGEGKLVPDTLVWSPGIEDWRSASEIENFKNLIVWPLDTGEPDRLEYHPDMRPTSVTVLGILNIVFGGLGILCTPVGLVATFAIPNAMNSTPVAKVWLLIGSVVGIFCSFILLIVGIGLLNLRRWARKWTLGYGWFAIVWGIVGMFVNVALAISGGMGNTPEAIGGVIGGFFGGIVGLVYPILLIIFMLKPHVKSACNR
ncbi:MAG: DUF4339 domain-containing protein [Planctomycetota bacterium]